MGTSLGLTETTTEVSCLENLVVRSLLRYLAEPIVTALAFWMEFLMKVKSCSSSSGRTSVGIDFIANCIAVGAWVNLSQGLSPTGKDWLRRRVRASKYGAYDSAGVLGLVPVRETAPRWLTFAMKPFARRQLDSVSVAAAMSGKEAAIRWARAWGAGLDLGAKKCLEAWGRDEGAFISWFPSLTTSVAEAPLVYFFLLPGPEPAACA